MSAPDLLGVHTPPDVFVIRRYSCMARGVGQAVDQRCDTARRTIGAAVSQASADSAQHFRQSQGSGSPAARKRMQWMTRESLIRSPNKFLSNGVPEAGTTWATSRQGNRIQVSATRSGCQQLFDRLICSPADGRRGDVEHDSRFQAAPEGSRALGPHDLLQHRYLRSQRRQSGHAP